MTSKTAKWIFYLGTLTSAALFLALTWDTHRQIGALTHADQLSDDVAAGKKVFQKYNCNDCHTILGFGGYYAPDLTKVYKRRGEQYIRQIVTQPEVVLAKSFRKMPQQHVSEAEINQLLTFFSWVNGIDNHDWPPQDSPKRKSRAAERLSGNSNLSLGAALFKENNCFSCHKLLEIGGDIGPSLDEVGDRLDWETIKKHIADPQSIKQDSQMPAYPDLSAEELQAIAEFLVHQKGAAR